MARYIIWIRRLIYIHSQKDFSHNCCGYWQWLVLCRQNRPQNRLISY